MPSWYWGSCQILCKCYFILWSYCGNNKKEGGGGGGERQGQEKEKKKTS